MKRTDYEVKRNKWTIPFPCEDLYQNSPGGARNNLKITQKQSGKSKAFKPGLRNSKQKC